MQMKTKTSIPSICLMMAFLMALMAVAPAFGRDITGTVVSESNAPLDFVNVVLYRDSTYITGAITGSDGKFAITTDAPGKLTAKVSFLGYQTHTTVVPTDGSLGVIKLAPSAIELGEVVARATRPSHNNERECTCHKR